MPSAATISPGLPSGLCANKHYDCDDLARNRWLMFQSAGGIGGEQDKYLLVGACSRNGASNPEVFALVGLLQAAGQIYFDVKISFYDDLSVFQNTPASELHNIFPKIKRRRNRMSLTSAYAYIDYSPNSPVRYWLRFNRIENRLVMVAYFGYLDTLLCEFS